MIRKYEVNDYDTIRNIMTEFDTPFSLSDSNNIYIYENENDFVGFIDYSLIIDRVELNYIYVIEKYRGNNCASELMNHMINDVKEKVINITLEVAINNDSAIGLYKKFGFVICAVRKNYYKNNDAYLMLKEW